MAKYIHNGHRVTLTTNEVYTLLLLIGRVAGDDESYSLYDKLSYFLDRELDVGDYEKVVFVGETESEDWCIRIEEGEKE